MEFDRAIKFILEAEGGYVNDPRDPGGETNFGISHRVYPHLDIKGLTPGMASDIYKSDYWDKLRIGELPDLIRLLVLDGSVNQGQTTMAGIVQNVAEVKTDGVIGDHTIAALNGKDEKTIFDKICFSRIAHYQSDTRWTTYGRNWSKRLIKAILYTYSN